MACIVKGRFSIHQRATWSILRSDNKRPDGLTLIPWRDGRCATWDVTDRPITYTHGLLLLDYVISLCSPSHHFFPIAFETFGPINQVGADFISALGHRISILTLTTHERHFSFFNAVLLRSSALMPSVSPIRSVILRWKCDVTSRDTPSSCFFHS